MTVYISIPLEYLLAVILQSLLIILFTHYGINWKYTQAAPLALNTGIRVRNWQMHWCIILSKVSSQSNNLSRIFPMLVLKTGLSEGN